VVGAALELTKVNRWTITLADADVQASDVVTCLGVVIDSRLTFTHNVKKLAGIPHENAPALSSSRCFFVYEQRACTLLNVLDVM